MSAKDELKKDFEKLAKDLVLVYEDIVEELGEAFNDEPADTLPEYDYHTVKFANETEKLNAIRQILKEGKLVIRRKKKSQ